ncbi:hypothetical protein ITF21_12030 [Acinetobacter baumannii]|uniref:hypothetical protein n=1 Tax=Acinetobacter baumannii TaxID=470 RepID=UPI000A7953A1|nr:hypothetical protein [Acinetobacter baumannii]EHU1489815.1 hypothetical protein [Acinetobacter baumannii]EKW4080269.1 hypothetical protein [Acinetobacter baumannii]MBH8273459.1 hypothetical protein [Acinetobacter baumannii]MBH8346212.1 hypothetical protein [Acinetobacter baumannii]MBH8435227.1 hypothetical protein [Acinetobacter baumannii]
MNKSSTFEKLNHLIELYIKNNEKKPEKILIGYKSYSDLMNNSVFFDEVTNSALDPNKRKFQKIKIKITKDDYQLDLE